IRGPMTGILTALINTRHEWVFISACDMPFLSRELIEHMALARKNTHAVIPMLKNRAEPLFAFYSRKFISSMERSLLEGEKSLINFLLNHKKRVQYIPSGEVKLKDPEGRSFINLNTVEDATGNLSKKDLIKFKNTVSGRTQCLEQRN
ncbi:molybdenum cofactor guanylyltransferase, partial [bacterium]|nr:molybdenum cofactor guanylyltransferase [bacterium]